MAALRALVLAGLAASVFLADGRRLSAHIPRSDSPDAASDASRRHAVPAGAGASSLLGVSAGVRRSRFSPGALQSGAGFASMSPLREAAWAAWPHVRRGGPAAIGPRGSRGAHDSGFRGWPLGSADKWRTVPESQEEQPGKKRIKALNLEGEVTKITVPQPWHWRIKKGTVREVLRKDGERLFKAKVGADPSMEVMIKELPNGGEAWRESFMSQLLQRQVQYPDGRKGGNIITHFDIQWLRDKTYILLEGYSMTLKQLLARHQVRWPDMPKEQMPPGRLMPTEGSEPLDATTAIPLLIDILRGVIVLDEAGVVHGALTPENIVFKDGRAIINGLGHACFLFGDDGQLSGDALEESPDREAGAFVASATAMAPEMKHGRPNDPANHVWGAGLIYAWMRLGYNPVERVAAMQFPENMVLRMHDMLADGREHIRERIREHFDIRDDPSFSNLDIYEQELLKGMLDPDRSRRWPAEDCLSYAVRISEARNIEVRPEREPAHLPGDWQEQVEKTGVFREANGEELDNFVEDLLGFDDDFLIDYDYRLDEDDTQGGRLWNEGAWE